MLLLIDLAVLIAFDDLQFVVTRGYLVEIFTTLRHEAVFAAFSVLAVMIRTEHVDYPKPIFLLFGVLYFVFSYSTRIFWKYFLRTHPIRSEAKRPS
jgi:hypothetical protein